METLEHRPVVSDKISRRSVPRPEIVIVPARAIADLHP
jgi:hypothetical protein